jgi:hypothetical protein
LHEHKYTQGSSMVLIVPCAWESPFLFWWYISTKPIFTNWKRNELNFYLLLSNTLKYFQDSAQV